MPGRIGEIFGSYKLIQFLGRGGFAEVYLGQHTQLPQQMAAIKILDKQLVMNKSQQFQKEASIVATLHHPNIVQMYDYNVYSNPNLTVTLVPYIVMEYAPNKSLRVKHPRGLALPLKTTLTYTRQIADALQYAHEQNVMHLDVKPENILINAQNKLLLSDFGLATLLTEEEKTGDVQGTLSYMSPEQLDGKPGFASDQYALAVMTYEWISGYLPFTGQSVKEVIEKHLTMPPPSLCARVTSLPSQAEAVIFKGLAKSAADRFPSIEAFALALDQALSLPARANQPAAPSAPKANPFLVPDPAAGAAPTPNMAPVPSFPGPLPGQVNPQPAPSFAGLPGQPAAAPVPPFPQQNQGISPGQAPAFPQTPVTPVNASQAALPGGPLPLTPPNAGVLPINPPAQPGNTPAPLAAALAANSPFTPPQAASNFVAPNVGASPFQPGLPPGAQAPAATPFQMGGAPPPAAMPFQPGLPLGAQALSSPFVNVMGSSPSSTTAFASPMSPPFAGAGPGGPSGPGPLPPYGTTGYYSAPLPRKKNLSSSIKKALKQPSVAVRRRRLPFLVAGIPLNLIGAILIGRWISLAVTEHDTGWWAFIFAALFGLGAVTLFYNSGNRWLNISLSIMLAIYWGFIGVSIGALTTHSFLPGPDVLAFLCFVVSLLLHLYLTYRRR